MTYKAIVGVLGLAQQGGGVEGKNEKPFVTVKFDTPVFGLWSCKSKNVPFVCIEPWYGRTDAIDFTGELKDREYSNHLDVGEVFEKSFSILFY